MQSHLEDHQPRPQRKSRRRNPPLPPCTEQPRCFADIPQHAKDAFHRRLKCAAPDECWPWPCKPGDYGQLQWCDARGRWHIGAHRLAWIIANKGDIPAGHLVLHSCDNPSCCNPAHLRIGTHWDNVHDAFARGRMNGLKLRTSTPEPDYCSPEYLRAMEKERAPLLAELDRQLGLPLADPAEVFLPLFDAAEFPVLADPSDFLMLTDPVERSGEGD